MAYLDIETPEGTHRIALERERLCIGRMATNDVVLAFPQVSRQHAELRFVGGQWWIADLHSTNGLQLDARRIQDHALRDGDRVVLAPGISIRFDGSGANPSGRSRRASGALWEDSHSRAASSRRSSPLSRSQPTPAVPIVSAAPLVPPLPAAQPAPSAFATPVGPSAGAAAGPAGSAGFSDPAPFALWSAAPTAGPAPIPTPAPAQTVPVVPSESDAYASVANATRAHGGYPVPRGPLHSGAPVGGDDPFRRDAPSSEAGRATAGPAVLLHICQTCGQRTDPSAIYCQHCHNSIASECANCRLSLLPIQDRCPRCHTPNLHSVRRTRARPTAM